MFITTSPKTLPTLTPLIFKTWIPKLGHTIFYLKAHNHWNIPFILNTTPTMHPSNIILTDDNNYTSCKRTARTLIQRDKCNLWFCNRCHGLTPKNVK